MMIIHKILLNQFELFAFRHLGQKVMMHDEPKFGELGRFMYKDYLVSIRQVGEADRFEVVVSNEDLETVLKNEFNLYLQDLLNYEEMLNEDERQATCDLAAVENALREELANPSR